MVSLFSKQIYKKVKKTPLLLSIDVAFYPLIFYFTGGLASPFFLCGFSPLLTSALLFKFKGALYSVLAYSSLYVFELLSLNGYSAIRLAHSGEFNFFITYLASFFLVAIFFAYPIVLLGRLENSKKEIEIEKNNLEQTHGKLEIAYKLHALSQREMDVLELISQGKSNKEIARTLSLSESTIKTHVSSVLKKLKLKSRTEAISYFLKENYLK